MSETTVTTPAPVKRTRKTNPPPPPFDFKNVKPVKAAPVMRKNGATKADNPTVAWLEESWGNRTGQLGAGVKVTVPAANVQQTRNLINYAARDLNLGVAFAPPVPKPGKMVELHFSAKPRKQKRDKPAAS